MATNWIDCDKDKLVTWQCKLETYKLLKIKGERNASSDEFIQDAISWTVFFIGSIVALALVYSAILLIFAWWNQSTASKWKAWIKYSIIWLLLVIFSYAIIRTVQYISTWQ